MVLVQLIASFIATASFGILFHVPKRVLLQCGFVGMVGWMVYILLMASRVDPVIATASASFLVTVISQLFAKWYKMPIIIFAVSGIMPLVPGGQAYDAMRQVALNQYDLAVALGAKAFMLSGSIALGMVLAEVINQLIRRSRI